MIFIFQSLFNAETFFGSSKCIIENKYSVNVRGPPVHVFSNANPSASLRAVSCGSISHGKCARIAPSTQ